MDVMVKRHYFKEIRARPSGPLGCNGMAKDAIGWQRPDTRKLDSMEGPQLLKSSLLQTNSVKCIAVSVTVHWEWLLCSGRVAPTISIVSPQCNDSTTRFHHNL